MNKDRLLVKAKRVDNNKWVTGFYVYSETPDEPTIHSIFPSNPLWAGPKRIDPDTICQCTGLKDRNGKLIFEGDVLDGRRIVVYETTEAAYSVAYEGECPHGYLQGYECLEVIGNIHDKEEE